MRFIVDALRTNLENCLVLNVSECHFQKAHPVSRYMYLPWQ